MVMNIPDISHSETLHSAPLPTSGGSDFPSDAMLWIKEVEMVDSLDE